MNNMKKLLALLLAVVMVVGMFPMGAMAEETEPTETTVPETTAAAAQIDEADPCEVCGETTCTETHVQCATCGTWDCQEKHETTPPAPTDRVPPATPTTPATTTPPTTTPPATTTPQETTAPSTPVVKCGICQGEHEDKDCTYCLHCKTDRSGCTVCAECGEHAGDHSSNCSQYKTPDMATPPEVETLFDKLMATKSVEEMYQVVLEYMFTEPDTLKAMTEEEIRAVLAYIDQLDPEKDDTDYVDLTDTLTYLPAMKCPECGEYGGHAEECPRNITTYGKFNVPSNKGQSTIPINSDITVNLFDYGSMMNSRRELPFGVGGASNAYMDYQFFNHTGKVKGGTIDDYAGINGPLGTWPVLVDGYPAMPYGSAENGAKPARYIKADYFFSKDTSVVPLATAMPHELAVRIEPGQTSYDGYTFDTVLPADTPSDRKVPMYESLRYPVTSVQLFKENADGYYSFDSKHNHMWYDFDSKSLVVEDYAVRPESVDHRYWGMGHYLPFNGHIGNYEDGQDALKIVNTPTPKEYNTNFTVNGIATRNKTPSQLYAIRTSPANNSATSSYLTQDQTGKATWSGTIAQDNRPNMWTGMSVEFTFNQKEGGKDNGNDVVYEFSGDDLMWVYIDDVLVLDVAMSGIHDRDLGGSKTATINFSTGDVVLYKVDGTINDVPDSNGDGKKTIVDIKAACATGMTNAVAYVTNLRQLFETAKNQGYIDTIPEFKEGTNTFADFTSHSFKMFYMDSGHGTSNCLIKFNLDPVPTNDVTLTKEVTGINESLSDDQEYSFTLAATNADHKPVTNIPYTIENGTLGTINNGGTIKLRAGQTVTFQDLPAGTDVSFTEEKTEFFTDTSWTCEDQAYTEGTLKDLPSGNNALNFVCTNQRITKTLTVTKIVDGEEYAPAANDEFEFVVKIGNNPYTGLAKKTTAGDLDFNDETGSVKIKAGESFVIEGIPSGMNYEVTEVQPAARDEYVYDGPTYSSNSGKLTDNVLVTITNTLRLLFGNLTITKTGIDPLDYNGDENQSTIYEISGTSTNGTKVNLEVVIVNNSSVTIKDLPVGNYTVKEKTEWAWRYVPEATVVSATIEGNKTTTKEFNNSRTKTLWLSGDCHAKNLWGNNSITPRGNYLLINAS